jgi:hypothetical protein
MYAAWGLGGPRTGMEILVAAAPTVFGDHIHTHANCSKVALSEKFQKVFKHIVKVVAVQLNIYL